MNWFASTLDKELQTTKGCKRAGDIILPRTEHQLVIYYQMPSPEIIYIWEAESGLRATSVNSFLQTSNMAFVAKTDDLSLMPVINIVEGENWFCKLSSDLYRCTVTHSPQNK